MRIISIKKRYVVIMAVALCIMMAIYCANIITATAQGTRFTAWVLCTPTGSVNVRSRPDVSGQKTGRLYLGDEITVDSTTKTRNWVHSADLATEDGHGWVSAQFVTVDPVDLTQRRMVVDANGRVAVWETMSMRGRTGWIYPGEALTVYAISGEWAVIGQGFVHLGYLMEVSR